MKPLISLTTLTLVALLPAGAALADDAGACGTVRLSDPGWTDITATNGVAAVILGALGYKADVKTLSVPIGYEAMKNAEIDAFLGNWMPAQQKFRDDLDAAGSVTVLAQNLQGAKFTLGVNKAGAALGVRDLADLDAHKDAFSGQIYGIEPGAPANQSIAAMIAQDKFGLNDWQLVESGEQAMLAQLAKNDVAGTPAVFLAWAPHPMNIAHQITYLSGADAEFGPDFGGASVHTLARKAWVAQCPNAARLLRQLTFNVDMENALMGAILNEGADGPDAARAWLKAHPDAATPWLDGVTTLDGKPAAAALQAAL